MRRHDGPALDRTRRGDAKRETAFAEALLADYLGDPVPLVMAAYAKAFCDMLTACSESGSAAQLINLANSQLWPAGFQVTALPGRAGLKNA